MTKIPVLAVLGVLCFVLSTHRSAAAEIDLATVSCSQYENEILAPNGSGYGADPIDLVMWLFGFSVAKSGEHVMYGDSLTPFGFALDAVCKNNPATMLREAVTTVKSKRNNAMDLERLDCASFEKRHAALRKSDPESANTLMMWLFGFSVGISGGHTLAADALTQFDGGLEARCSAHPNDSLFAALSAPNPAVATRPAGSAHPSLPKR